MVMTGFYSLPCMAMFLNDRNQPIVVPAESAEDGGAPRAWGKVSTHVRAGEDVVQCNTGLGLCLSRTRPQHHRPTAACRGSLCRPRPRVLPTVLHLQGSKGPQHSDGCAKP